MQSRVAVGTVRPFVVSRGRVLGQLFASGSASTTRRTADPEIHSGNDGADPAVYPRDPENLDDVANPKPANKEHETETLHGANKDTAATEPLASPPRTPRASTSQKLETTTPVNQRVDPTFQQKRQNGNVTSSPDSVSCAGLDGSPWPEDAEDKNADQDHHRTESDKEYYEHHKASPLSEIEIADTRKPITQATDGTAAPSEYGVGKDVIGWLPEQMDTAEESLRRAAEIFRQSAVRGDPETLPHSRVLREMRGEWF